MLRRRISPNNEDINVRGGDKTSKGHEKVQDTKKGAVAATKSPSKIRDALFPLYGAEVNKFLLMGSIKFFVIMALTLTRDLKDTLVVTQCGAEAIAFLKVRQSIYT